MIPEVQQRDDLKRNNYNNVGAKLNINPATICSVWEYMGKTEEVNFEMGLEGRIEVYRAEKGKEILSRGENRDQGIEVRKDLCQCDQNILKAQKKVAKRLNFSAALRLGRI